MVPSPEAPPGTRPRPGSEVRIVRRDPGGRASGRRGRVPAFAIAACIGLLLAGGPPGARAQDPPARTQADAGRVDVNSATAAELAERLTGIGAVKARALVAHREAHGPFASLDALIEVRGIGPKTLERLRPQLTLGAALDRRHQGAELRTRDALAAILARARAADAGRDAAGAVAVPQ